MIPGINPRKMQQMMRQMGIQQTDLPATEVIIKLPDKELVIANPAVAKVNMMGQETFQISGEAQERELSVAPEISDEDVKIIVQQTGASQELAKQSLREHHGDIAETIIALKNEKI
ncbi:nascent polypeptide-associated complex protein [Candidatus Woesearchaeota archaeon]|nr:nascent polypeptide-associated complex protein [Candidatus Woesearchaeota archaeon]